MNSLAPLEFHGHRFELEEVPCDFCGGTRSIPFWDTMRHEMNLPTVMCEKCGLCMSAPRPTPAALELFYSKLYNLFHHRESPIDPDGEYVRRTRRQAGPRVTLLSRFLPPSADVRVIEIGAGVGQTQRTAREQTKWRISGIEPGKPQHEVCQHFGLDVRNAFFDDQSGLEEGAYDCVISFHVLEHVRSPADFIRRANRLLKPNGLLHLEVPNLGRPGTSLTDFLQFPHLYNFTATTLRNYLQAIGGFRPIYIAERSHNLVITSRKIAPPNADTPAPDQYELHDVDNFVQYLRRRDRLFKVAAALPPLPVLGRVRGQILEL